MSKIGAWSTTAASNNATPPDGWPEGQAPSTVNDCARENMAQIKAFAQDAEWFDFAFTPTQVNANSFTVTGDQTAQILAGRQCKLYDAGNTYYRKVATATYTVVTTVSLGAGTAITSSLSSFAMAILKPTNQSFPSRVSHSALEVTGIMSLSAAAITVVNAGSLSVSAAAQITGNLGVGGYLSASAGQVTGMFSASAIQATGNVGIAGYLSASAGQVTGVLSASIVAAAIANIGSLSVSAVAQMNVANVGSLSVSAVATINIANIGSLSVSAVATIATAAINIANIGSLSVSGTTVLNICNVGSLSVSAVMRANVCNLGSLSVSAGIVASIGAFTIANVGSLSVSAQSVFTGTMNSSQIIRAWALISASAGGVTIASNFGIASALRSATGAYQLTLSTALTDANACVQATIRGTAGGGIDRIVAAYMSSNSICKIMRSLTTGVLDDGAVNVQGINVTINR